MSSEAVDPAYRRLPTEGPHEPTLGGALITWVEPSPDHVVGYNRWYEDDHFITGALSMPWLFSGRRYVAPRWLQPYRGPEGSRVAQPLEAGKYIALYWINPGRIEDHQEWSLGANNRLHAEGRGSYRGLGHDPSEERSHVFTCFADFAGATYRDDEVPESRHTLLQPYEGLVVELYDPAEGQDRADLDRWLAEEHLPSVVGGPVAVSLRFLPRPLPGDKLSHVKELEGIDQVVTVLHFLETDPRDWWDEKFSSSQAQAAAGGVGTLAVQAAFIPTKHGTNAYTDELF